MARPRAATDEQIIEAAEDLAKENGWQNVYAPTVHSHMNVGGSLSTFSKVIKAWRLEKEAEAGSQEAQVAEIVRDRVSIIDDGMGAIVETLKKLSETVNTEIDRAVTDERRKSERLRADDKAAHDKAMEDLRARVDAMSAEIDALAEEAGSETDRADRAEEELEASKVSVNDLMEQLRDMSEELKKIPALEGQLKAAQNEVEKTKTETERRIHEIKTDALGQIKKAEEREAKALAAVEAKDKKIEKIEGNLSQAKEDLATARSDLTNARSERSNTAEKLKSSEAEIIDLKKQIEDEKARADRAWDRMTEIERK